MRFHPENCVIYLPQRFIFQFFVVGAFIQDYDQPSLSILRVAIMVISATNVFVSFLVQDVKNGSNVTFDGCEIGVLEFG
jgi:hypothetical protein